MSSTPFKTGNDIIDAIKRRIAFPFSQNTFSEEDVLVFANEEMDIGQVPSVLQFHEDYFTFRQDTPLKANRVRYPIPERAIGQRIKDLHYVDTNGNETKLFQVLADDRSAFSEGQTSYPLTRYYFEGNDIVLLADPNISAAGSLRFTYYLRPNRIVKDERAAICQYFTKNITIDNTSLVAGDSVFIGSEEFIAGTDFAIGGTSTITATNLVTAINLNGVALASNGTIPTAIVLVRYSELDTSITAENTSAFTIQAKQGIQFDNIPENITNSSKVDFLQTWGGHKTYGIDKLIGSNAISENIIEFNASDVHEDFKVGDYICSHHECIIPQIPDDLHISLVERTCAAILTSFGDVNGSALKQQAVKEIEMKQGSLIDNRSEGSPKKVNNLNSHLRNSKRRNFTRY